MMSYDEFIKEPLSEEELTERGLFTLGVARQVLNDFCFRFIIDVANGVPIEELAEKNNLSFEAAKVLERLIVVRITKAIENVLVGRDVYEDIDTIEIDSLMWDLS